MAITLIQFLDRRSAEKKKRRKKSDAVLFIPLPSTGGALFFFAHCAVSIIDCDGFCRAFPSQPVRDTQE